MLIYEAVRLAALYLVKDEQFDFIGFINPDLDVNFRDLHDLAKTIFNSNFEFVSGSAPIQMEDSSIFDLVIANGIKTLINKTINMKLHDALCGAKIRSKEVVEKTFSEKFKTNQTFDLEILMRMKKEYGNSKTKKIVFEQPLQRWMNCDTVSISLLTSFNTFFQIGQIALHYK